MKKLVLVLSIIALGFTSNAQISLDSTALVTYQISTTGYSVGLIIPDTFYISVMSFDLQRNGGYHYVSTTQTYLDTFRVVTIHNDSLFYSKNYPVTKSQLNNYTPIQMFQNTVKLDLDNIYGSENVAKLN